MRTILVVDDSVDLQVIISMILKGEGYAVQVASNGKEALDLLSSNGLPSLILLDLMMPIMDGWEFLKTQKTDSNLSQIPTVVCSAIEPVQIECAGFLKKPVDLNDLVETVRRHCG